MNDWSLPLNVWFRISRSTTRLLGLHVIPESYITCNYAFFVTRQSIVKCTPFLSVSEQNYPAFDEIYIGRK